MKLSRVTQALYNELAELTIVDAHEHLPPEKAYLSYQYSGANFFAGYIRNDLVSAGLPVEFKNTMRDPGYKDVSEWWPQIAPYWERVKEGSHARAAIITARELYGIEEINDRTINRLADAIIADNTSGLYTRILSERCKARVVLTCVERTDFQDDPLFRVVAPIDVSGTTADSFERLGESTGIRINTLDDLVDASIHRLYQLKETKVVVGFKTKSFYRFEPDEGEANALFKRIRAGQRVIKPFHLRDYLFDKLAGAVADLDMPIAVHAGVWGDFRELDPKYTIDLAIRYPDVHFDLFHLGMPMVRDAAIIGKNFPNVSLNLCWCPVVSQRLTVNVLNEILDLVPLNKIIAFGADYRCVVQKAVGHLVMAREVVASVLGERIESGEITEERALEIGKMWFHDNASEIYKV